MRKLLFTAAWLWQYSNFHFHLCDLPVGVGSHVPPAAPGRASGAWHTWFHADMFLEKSDVTGDMHSLGVNYCQVSWSVTGPRSWKQPRGTALLQMISQPLPPRAQWKKMFVGLKGENCFTKKNPTERAKYYKKQWEVFRSDF